GLCSATVNDPIDYRLGRLRSQTIAGVSEDQAEVAEARGEYAATRAYLEESLPLRRDLGHPRQAAFTLRRLGQVALRQGDWEGAGTYFRESLAFCRQDEDSEAKGGAIAACLEGLGAVAAGQGEPARAARWLGAA